MLIAFVRPVRRVDMACKLDDFDDVATWPAPVETYFINLLLKESHKGLHTSTLDQKTWKAIDNDMFSKFGRRYAIPKLKSKFNRLRKMYREFSNLLSQTGAHYDPATNVVHADADVWEAYLKVMHNVPFFNSCHLFL